MCVCVCVCAYVCVCCQESTQPKLTRAHAHAGLAPGGTTPGRQPGAHPGALAACAVRVRAPRRAPCSRHGGGVHGGTQQRMADAAHAAAVAHPGEPSAAHDVRAHTCAAFLTPTEHGLRALRVGGS